MSKDNFLDIMNEIFEEVENEFSAKNRDTAQSSQSNFSSKASSEMTEAASFSDAVVIKNDIETNFAKKPASERLARMYEKIHDGHRNRVRESAEIDSELDSFADHEILEYLLFFAIPRIDTNPLAHDLLHRFNTLHAVFNTPKDILLQVPQMTERAVSLLQLVLPAARRIERSRTRNTKHISTTANAVEIFKPIFFNRNCEYLYILCLDTNDNMVGLERISEGDVNFTAFDVKKIALAISKYGASKVIMAHNHPAGTTTPSVSDIKATKRVQIGLAAMSILLIDHLIIAGDNYYSFYHEGKMDAFYDDCDNVFDTTILKELRERRKKKPSAEYVLEKDTYVFMCSLKDNGDEE